MQNLKLPWGPQVGALHRHRPGFGCTGLSQTNRGRCSTDTSVCISVKLHICVGILASSKRRKSVKSTSSRVRDDFMSRKQPNILVTGTPGTGKTTTCQQIIEAIGFTHINVGDWVKQHELHSGWDEEHGCYIIDEDKVCLAVSLFSYCLCCQTACICFCVFSHTHV